MFYFLLCLFFQWQCKADLENTYRFGQMEVSCEGYDYPDDPYILRGSCSLLFKLELTAEGERKMKNSGSFGSSYYQSRKDYSDFGSGAIVVIVLLVLAFGIYKFFLSSQQSQQSSGGNDGFSRPFWQSQQTPPPPGFKSTFTGRALSHLQYSNGWAGLSCFICGKGRWDRVKPQHLQATAKLAAGPTVSFVFCSLFKRGNKSLAFHRLQGRLPFWTFEKLPPHALQAFFSSPVKLQDCDREKNCHRQSRKENVLTQAETNPCQGSTRKL